MFSTSEGFVHSTTTLRPANAQLSRLDLSPDLIFETLSTKMLSRLPHEVRLNIFHHVFAKVPYRVSVRVEDTAGGFRFNFERKDDSDRYAGAVSCIHTAKLDEGVAAAAAEALYRSKFTFGVDATILCNFLQNCPLSSVQPPGRYIKRLDFFMDEDPNFIGDGKNGQELRKDDWVDLVPGPGDDSTMTSTKRTQLMRQCWRAILNMPRLKAFDFFIMPSHGQAWADVIQHFEIRDIMPMHFRLLCRNINASIYVHFPDALTKIVLNDTEDMVFAFHNVYSHPNSIAGDFYESYVNLSSCIPCAWFSPTAEDRASADHFAARLGVRPPANWFDLLVSLRLRAIRNYDAFRHYHRRIVAAKGQYLSRSFNVEIFANML